GADRFNAAASLENRGKIANMTTTVKNVAMGKTSYRHYDYIKGESKGILWNYNINDNVKFTHNYVENNNVMDVIDNTYLKSPYQRKEYDDHNNTFALAIDDKNGFTSNLSYGTQERNYDQITWKKDGTISKAIKYSWRKGYNTNLNVQKIFDVNEKDKFLLGASFKREELDVYGSAAKKMGNTPAKPERTGNYNRDIYSLYASYDWQMTDADKLIVNLRETFVRNAKGDNTDLSTGITTKTVQMNQNKFTPEIQYIRDLTDNSSFYAKAGKSYRLPELTKIFGGSVILPSVDLKPEHGVHYEMGYKLNEANRSWRLAVFNYDVKDAIESISGTAAEGNLIYSNTDVKNTGVELSLNVKHNDNLDSFWGVTYSNPKQKSFKTSSSAGGEWIKYNNQFQFNMGINYHADKFASALSANYIGMRTDGTSAVHDRMKPALYTDLHFSYAPEKNQKAFLHINNLLDRKDYTTSKGPDETTYGYYTTGINFMVGYEYSF
ncbi:TonB-dependent receptor domain-containing protein, partial [Phascolarctobacterium succinatutens]